MSSGLQANSSFNITLRVIDGSTRQTETVPVVIHAPVAGDADERFRFAIDVVIDGVLGRASRR